MCRARGESIRVMRKRLNGAGFDIGPLFTSASAGTALAPGATCNWVTKAS